MPLAQPRNKYFSMTIFSSNYSESPNSIITKGTEMGLSMGEIHYQIGILITGHLKFASLPSILLLVRSRAPAVTLSTCRHQGSCPQPNTENALLHLLPLALCPPKSRSQTLSQTSLPTNTRGAELGRSFDEAHATQLHLCLGYISSGGTTGFFFFL